MIFFFRFTWFLTHFKTTITLSKEELESFAKMHLASQNMPESKSQSSMLAKQNNSRTTKFPLGVIYFKQVQADRVGLLCETLSAESLSF